MPKSRKICYLNMNITSKNFNRLSLLFVGNLCINLKSLNKIYRVLIHVLLNISKKVLTFFLFLNINSGFEYIQISKMNSLKALINMFLLKQTYFSFRFDFKISSFLFDSSILLISATNCFFYRLVSYSNSVFFIM